MEFQNHTGEGSFKSSDTFNFKVSNEYYNYLILDSDITLRIERKSPSIASLCFIDNNSNTINVPNNIKLYTFDFQNPNKKVIYNNVIDKKYYCLCWTDNYLIEYNGIILFEIMNTRSWNIVEK